MSKIVAGTAFVLLGGATVAGGVLLGRKDGKGQDEKAQEKQPDIELPITLAELNQKVHEKGCVPAVLPGLTDVSTVADAVNSGDVTEHFLTESGKKKETQGCLVVNWDKKSKKGASGAIEKWSGTFRLLWAAKGETKGFLVLLVGTTSNSTDKKITWTGSAYTLAKEEGNAWKAKKKHAVGDSKTFAKSSEDNQFPSPGEALTAVKNKAFWGLMGSKDEVEKIDAGDELTSADKYRGHWDWVGSEGTDDKALDGWTKELSKWWDAIFTKTNWDMAQVVKDSKATWTLKSETPASTAAK